MARPITSHKKMLRSLILALFVRFTSSLSLEQQLQELKNNYIELKEDFSAKVVKLEAMLEQKKHDHEILAAKVCRLEEITEIKVQQQEILPTKNTFNSGNEEKSAILRTCHETRAAEPLSISGMYWVDPDGQGVGDDPIYVYCNMTTGSTSVLHDSESTNNLEKCSDPGCYSRPVKYYATPRQMTALADLSNECHQFINYDCTNAPLEVNGVTYSWWNDRNGVPRQFWPSGNTTDAQNCQCGIVADKNILPVTRLNFGQTQLDGLYTLGRFECKGQMIANGMPTSCTDLWQIGHTLSGLYSVMGEKQIESVYCDFTKQPSDPYFQSWIGYVDVKSSPIYFNVQLFSEFNITNTPIPFTSQNLNVGGAMNMSSGIFTAPVAGKYFFSFSGLTRFLPSPYRQFLYIDLYVNSTPTNVIGYADERVFDGYESEYETCSLQSTMHLQAEDQVSVQISGLSSGSLLEGASYTHFTGWLMEEDISQSLKVAYAI